MSSANRAAWLAIIAAAFAVPAGCRASREVRDPEFAAVQRQVYEAATNPSPTAAAVPVAADGVGELRHADEYVAAALAQNPSIQAARKRVDAAAHRVSQAASLEDPMLDSMGYPIARNAQQTVSGRMTAQITASQKLPWIGKLRARAEAAQAEANMARAQLAAAELEVVEQVKRAYYELYYLRQATRITLTNRRVLEDIVSVADIRYRAGAVSQQDLLRAQVEVASLENELIRLRQEQTTARARLARLLHASPDTPLETVESLPAETAPRDLDRLYQQAVTARPELHAALATLRRDRRQVDLARLAYMPDVTASFAWGEMTTHDALSPLADGIDNLSFGLGANVPIYRQRLDAGVREAEATVVATARDYDALKDATLQDVQDLFAQATSQQELARMFREQIIPKSQLTLEVSRRAYEAGQTDFLQWLDNWQQLLRFELSYHRLESQLRQTLASLERVVGGTLPSAVDAQSGKVPADQAAPTDPLSGQSLVRGDL